jgi:CRP-like cAMP-binding protein
MAWPAEINRKKCGVPHPLVWSCPPDSCAIDRRIPEADQGDSGTEVFMVTKGSASAYIHQATGPNVRLVTFAPGTVFGELAIFDAGPRSASIIADDDFVSYALSREQFSLLSTEAPAIAIKLLANLGRELSGRLRRADRMIDELEM